MNVKQGLSIKSESQLTPFVSAIATTTAQLGQHLRILRLLQIQYNTMRYLAEFIVSFDRPSIMNSGQIMNRNGLKSSFIQDRNELGLLKTKY